MTNIRPDPDQVSKRATVEAVQLDHYSVTGRALEEVTGKTCDWYPDEEDRDACLGLRHTLGSIFSIEGSLEGKVGDQFDFYWSISDPDTKLPFDEDRLVSQRMFEGV